MTGTTSPFARSDMITVSDRYIIGPGLQRRWRGGDYGVRDYGGRDYGVRDYGVRDWGVRDWRRRVARSDDADRREDFGLPVQAHTRCRWHCETIICRENLGSLGRVAVRLKYGGKSRTSGVDIISA